MADKRTLLQEEEAAETPWLKMSGNLLNKHILDIYKKKKKQKNKKQKLKNEKYKC